MANATTTKRAGETDVQAVRQAYYERIGKKDLAPLWVVLKDLVSKEPVTACVPAIWHFADVKGLVDEAGALISAKEAERRVLVWRTRRCAASRASPIRFMPGCS